jgi:predicted glycosyltransferase
VKENKLSTRIVCGFRDILDEKEKISEEWTRKGALSVLDEYYDSIFVYGDEDKFDFCSEYSLPENLVKKVVYTGYIQPSSSLGKEFFPLDFQKDRPIVTFTLGGGGDGWNYIDIFLQMIESRQVGDDVNFVLLTGPFANVPLVERAKKLEAARNNFKVLEFTSNSLGLFDRSKLVISMGGYNSFCELLQMRKFPLILPRVRPREEQLIRAKVFRQLGFCDYIHPGELSPELLGRKIREMVSTEQSALPVFKADGLENVARIIEETLGCRQKSDSFSRVIPA